MMSITWYMRKQIIHLAWPVILEMTGIMFVGMAITAMVGRLGATSLTAVGLATMIQFSSAMIFAAAGTGATAIVAREAGAGNAREVQRVAGQAITLGFAAGLAVAVWGYSMAPFVFYWVGLEPDVADLAAKLLRIMFVFTPFYLVMAIGNAVLRGTGNTGIAFAITTFANVWTLFISYALVFGKGVTAVGAYGAAWGTGMGQLIGGLLVLGVLMYPTSNIGLSIGDILHFHGATVRRILRLSIPSALEQLAMHGGRIMFNFMLAGAGAVQFAAFQIAVQVESLSFMPGFGFSVAAMTLVGRYLGKGLPHRAAQFVWITNSFAFWSMALMGLAFFAGAKGLVGIFIQDPAVIGWGALFVMIAALEQPSIAETYVFGGALRGAGDTRWPLYVTIVGVWLVRLPLVFLFIRMWHFDITVAWFITLFDFIVRGIVLKRRFRSNTWQRIAV